MEWSDDGLGHGSFGGQETCNVSQSDSVQGSMGIYWVDFKYGKKEIRIQLEAWNIDDATKKAKNYLKSGFKHVTTNCVR